MISSQRVLPPNLPRYNRHPTHGILKKNVHKSIGVNKIPLIDKINSKALVVSKRMSLQEPDYDLGSTNDDPIPNMGDMNKSRHNPFLAGGPSNELTTMNTQHYIPSPANRARLLSPEMTTQNSYTNTIYRPRLTPNSAEYSKHNFYVNRMSQGNMSYQGLAKKRIKSAAGKKSKRMHSQANILRMDHTSYI